MCNKTILISLAIALSASACGKKNDEQAQVTVAPPVAVNSQPQPAPQPQPFPQPSDPSFPADTYPQMGGGPNYYFMNYQFSVNGCTTGLRRFSGPTQYYVIQQVCSALHNESMNGNCARGMREQYARSLCGY